MGKTEHAICAVCVHHVIAYESQLKLPAHMCKAYEDATIVDYVTGVHTVYNRDASCYKNNADGKCKKFLYVGGL